MLPSSALLLARFLNHNQAAFGPGDGTRNAKQVALCVHQDDLQALGGHAFVTQVTRAA
jgi:hypothetical protein